jgi:hypothetical protein
VDAQNAMADAGGDRNDGKCLHEKWEKRFVLIDATEFGKEAELSGSGFKLVVAANQKEIIGIQNFEQKYQEDALEGKLAAVDKIAQK